MTRIGFFDSSMAALRGLVEGVLKERNIRIQFVMTTVLFIIAFLSKVQRAYLVTISVVCLFGIILELLNTSFERLVDVIHPDYNKAVKKFKDEVAGMVALTFMIALIISGFILYDPAIHLLGIISQNSLALWLTGINIGIMSIIIAIRYFKN